MTNKLFVTLWVIWFTGLAGAQSQDITAHPDPSGLASALQSVSVVLNRTDSSLSILATQFDSEETSMSMHVRRLQMSKLASQWAAIITVSNGKELPSASDLFTIYTEMLNVQWYSADLTREDRFNGEVASLARNGVTVVRGSTELLPVLETLRYAVADRIDVDEAECLKHQKLKR